jgi:hypothetical protein
MDDWSERLERQRAYFASDEHLRDNAKLWIDATPEECVAATYESCEEAAFFLSRLDPEALERALAPTPLPAETEALLIRLWNERKR